MEDVANGEHSQPDRHAGLKHYVLQAADGLTSQVLVVVGLPRHHRSQSHDCLAAPRNQRLSRYRELKGPAHPHDFDVGVSQHRPRSSQKPFRDFPVVCGNNHSDFQPGRIDGTK